MIKKLGLLLILLISYFNIYSDTWDTNKSLKITRALCASPLTEIPASPFATGVGPRDIAYSPNGNFLAIANGSSSGGINNSSVGMYQVDNTTGNLILIANYTSSVSFPFGLAFFPNGNFLSIVNNVGNTVTTFAVSPSGTLSVVQNISTGPINAVATYIAISANGKFAAVTNANINNIAYYNVNSTNGMLTSKGTAATQSTPFGITYFLNDQFLAVVNRDSNSVTIYSVDPTGVPTPINGTVAASSFTTQIFPRRIAISPNNQFAAVTNRNSDSVTIYAINQTTGAFTPVTGSLATSSFATGNSPNGVAYAPDNSFLIVANENSQTPVPGGYTISVYNVNPDGTLSFITTYPTTGLNSHSVAISPNSVFAAITNSSTTDTVNVFATTFQADNLSGTTNCNQPITLTYSACGTLPVVSAVSTPANGTASFSPTSVTYTPNTGFAGSDSFNYTVKDNAGRTTSALVSINVSIFAENFSVTTLENTPIDINVFTQSCGSNLSITQPSNGIAQINGSLITYTPNPGFFGTDSFTYSLSNGIDTSTGTITITVTHVIPPIPPVPPLPPTNIESALVKAIRNKYCPFLLKMNTNMV